LCNPGYYDIDGAKTLGCESTCVANSGGPGYTCTDGGGSHVSVSALPLPSPALAGCVSVSTFGGFVQTSAKYSSFGVLGDSMGGASAVFSSSSQYKNYGGLTAGLAP
jgi:hypothetical protein